MALTAPYDGSAWKTLQDLHVYTAGGSWLRLKNLFRYNGTSWDDVTPPTLFNVTWTNDGSLKCHASFDYEPTVVKSYRWRSREEANPFSAWTTTNTDGTSPDSTPQVTGAAAGNTILFEIQPFTGLAGAGDAGFTYSVSGIL